MSKKSELNIIKDKSGNTQRILVELSSKSSIIDFEVNMLQSNPSLPFLESKYLQINGKNKLVFDVGTKECLREFISKTDLKKSMLIDIIQSIHKIIMSCAEFMLDSNKVMLDLDYIFIDKKSSLVYMIFLPIDAESESSIEDEFSIMLQQIMLMLKSNKSILTPAEKKLLSKLNKKNLDLEQFERVFKLLNDENNVKNTRVLIEDEAESKERNLEIKDASGEANNNIAIKKIEDEKSIIEDSYNNKKKNNFSYLDEEEDEDEEYLDFKEYKSVQRFEQSSKNNKLNKVLILQLVIVMLIGSLVLVFSVDDKEYFIMMAVIMIFVFLLLLILIIMTFRKIRSR
jgi:hypothetical protein